MSTIPPLVWLATAVLFLSCNKGLTKPAAPPTETSNEPAFPVTFQLSDFSQELDTLAGRPTLPPCWRKIHWTAM